MDVLYLMQDTVYSLGWVHPEVVATAVLQLLIYICTEYPVVRSVRFTLDRHIRRHTVFTLQKGPE